MSSSCSPYFTVTAIYLEQPSLVPSVSVSFSCVCLIVFKSHETTKLKNALYEWEVLWNWLSHVMVL